MTAVSDLLTRGVLESDATTVTERLANTGAGAADATCTVDKPPHIIMVFDEFEFRRARDPGREGPGRLRRALQVRSTASSAR